MTLKLDSLEIGAQELSACKEAVQKMAYFNWLDAGRPEGNGLEFWLMAEREWIEHCYVPGRTCNGDRADKAPCTTLPATTAVPNKRSRRREKATA